MNSRQNNLTKDVKQSYQRYLLSQKIDKLIHKKLTFQNIVITKEYTPAPKNMRHIAVREIIKTAREKQPTSKIEIRNYNTQPKKISDKQQCDTINKVSPERLSPRYRKRPKSVNHRLNMFNKKSKESSPDKLFTTLSDYFNSQGTDKRRSNSLSDFNGRTTIKVRGFSPMAIRQSQEIKK